VEGQVGAAGAGALDTLCLTVPPVWAVASPVSVVSLALTGIVCVAVELERDRVTAAWGHRGRGRGPDPVGCDARGGFGVVDEPCGEAIAAGPAADAWGTADDDPFS
jgi:hypothetical protein